MKRKRKQRPLRPGAQVEFLDGRTIDGKEPAEIIVVGPAEGGRLVLKVEMFVGPEGIEEFFKPPVEVIVNPDEVEVVSY